MTLPPSTTIENLWLRRLFVAAGLVFGSMAVGYAAVQYMMAHAIIRVDKYDIRSEGILQVGDPAPDLPLEVVDGEPMRLADLWAEKPVVLVFGSYT